MANGKGKDPKKRMTKTITSKDPSQKRMSRTIRSIERPRTGGKAASRAASGAKATGAVAGAKAGVKAGAKAAKRGVTLGVMEGMSRIPFRNSFIQRMMSRRQD